MSLLAKAIYLFRLVICSVYILCPWTLVINAMFLQMMPYNSAQSPFPCHHANMGRARAGWGGEKGLLWCESLKWNSWKTDGLYSNRKARVGFWCLIPRGLLREQILTRWLWFLTKKTARPLLSNTELKNSQKRESKPPSCTFSKLI